MSRFLAIVVFCFAFASPALAQKPPVKAENATAFLSAQSFYLSQRVEQGDATLVDGSTLYMRLAGAHRFQAINLAVGGFTSRDAVGETQIDTSTGLRIEGWISQFYVTLMFGNALQTFKDRSVGERSGTAFNVALGLRSVLLIPRLFFDVSLERRTSTFTREDGRDLRRDIVDEQTLPLLGVGIWL